MTRKLGTGAEAWFSYDENGRMLAQDDATGHLAYSYAPKSYRVTEVSGKIGLDRSRDASSKNNFVYDASGRVVGDASKNLSIEYDMSGLPVLFTVKDGSDVYHAINVYDPQGWRVGVLEYTNNVLQSLRTDIMVDGKKELERRRDMVHATGATASQPSVSEYKMLYGAAGVLGRENAGGGREWYVKDYQGSLVMTIVNDAVGNVIAYEPYGSQKLLQANGDMPSEQYTGKEYVGRLGLYYFGARFFDPTFAMWLTPDPAGQYLNPYSYGGDPINAVDLYGLWKLGVGITIGWDHGFTLGAGVALDFGDEEMGANLDFGYTRNFGNHSNTWTAQAGGSVTIYGWNMGANLGVSYNNKTGTVLNYGTHGGYGGWGTGFYGANYWDTEGEYLGGTIGAELYYKNAYVGYEHGYSGMQGRGVCGGIRGFGFHAEYSQNGGFDWGGSTTAYLSAGNQSDIKAADGTTASMVTTDISIPTLGFNYNLGAYDVSSAGIRMANDNALMDIARKSGNADFVALVDEVSKSGKDYTADQVSRLFNFLEMYGYEGVYRGKHGDGCSKFAFRPNGSSQYGNIEFAVYNNGSSYASYNYAGLWIGSHLLIDWMGYKGRYEKPRN